MNNLLNIISWSSKGKLVPGEGHLGTDPVKRVNEYGIVRQDEKKPDVGAVGGTSGHWAHRPDLYQTYLQERQDNGILWLDNE